MKQKTDKQEIVCTQISYTGIPFLHADMKGNLYVQSHEDGGRAYPARKVIVTINGSSKRIKYKGKVYYFSTLKRLAFKEKNTITLGAYRHDDELPF